MQRLFLLVGLSAAVTLVGCSPYEPPPIQPPGGTGGTGGTTQGGSGGSSQGGAGQQPGGNAGKAGKGGSAQGGAGQGGGGNNPGGAGSDPGGGGNTGECGDGVKDGSEQCDTGKFGGATCTSEIGKPATGDLACAANCTIDTSACLFCGDGKINGTEKCDGSAPNNATCELVLGAGSTGSIKCKDDCTLDTSGCSAPISCGNGKKDDSEKCEGTDLGGVTCTSEVGKPATGDLTCAANCTIDTSACLYCGDAKKNGTEACDAADLGGATCESAVGTGSTGSVTCKADCTLDVSGCSPSIKCGNGKKDDSEKCEGTDLGGATCTSEVGKPATGDLACASNCTLDTSACLFCGDNKLNGTEKCDGADLGGATCASMVGPGSLGAITCKADCTLDISGCSPSIVCGDGQKNGPDQCDGADFGGATCTSEVGKPATGNLICAANCTIDSSACLYCGDAKKNGTEACDAADLGGATCASVTGHLDAIGSLTCKADCSGFDTTACTFCGDGKKNGAEECDGSAAGATCQAGFFVPQGQAITCGADCKLNTAACTNACILDDPGSLLDSCVLQ